MKSPRVSRCLQGPIGVTAIRLSSEAVIELEQLARDREQAEPVGNMLCPVPVSPPVNSGNKNNRNAVHVPKRLLAHDSWKLFGDLVEAVVKEDQTCRLEGCAVQPLDVTILTNDVCCFCDTKEDSHKRGLKRFWERMEECFLNDQVRSIHIVVAETGSITREAAAPREHDCEAIASRETNGDFNSDQMNTKELPYVRCFHALKKQLTKLAGDDFNRMCTAETPGNHRVVDLSTIADTQVGYNVLVRKWTKETMSPHHSNFGRISFDLPETVDGMQCTLSLDASYKLLPFRADSQAAISMLADLQLLSDAHFEVHQLVPLSCVDASLIFGVPFIIRAALENDIQHYKEMKLLVNYLLRHLCENEFALLLRTTGEGKLSGDFGPPLFHTDGQSFLLMAEDQPGQDLAVIQGQNQSDDSSMPAPAEVGKKMGLSTGMMFRYATADQLLDAGSNEAFTVDEDAETLVQLAECVENSLDFLESNSVNPLIFNESSSSRKYVKARDCSPVPEEEWTDDGCGVGRRIDNNVQDTQISF